VDGHPYRGSHGRLIRFQQHDRRLNIAVTEYKCVGAAGGVRTGDQPPPREFSRVELFWTEKRVDRDRGGVKHHCRVPDLAVREYEPFACVKRLCKSVTVQDLRTGVPVMSAIVCDRLRVVAKYRSYVFRLSRSAQNSQNQRRRVRLQAAAATAAAGVQPAVAAADGSLEEEEEDVKPVMSSRAVDDYKRSV
jgi:hypothetical protein